MLVGNDGLDQIRVLDPEQQRAGRRVGRDDVNDAGRKADHHVPDQTDLTVGLVGSPEADVADLLLVQIK